VTRYRMMRLLTWAEWRPSNWKIRTRCLPAKLKT